MAAHIYKHAQNHLTVYSEWVICMICEFYLNKAILKKSLNTSVTKRSFLWILLKMKRRISLVVQWLGLWVPNARGPGSIQGQGTKSQMLQVK